MTDMKNVATFMVLFFMGFFLYAQENDKKVKTVKKGDVVEITYFYETGTISQLGYLKDNKPHGIWKSFDKTGKKTAQATYENGVKQGRWFFWKDDKLTEVEYNSNEIVSVNDYKKTDSYVMNP